MTHMPGNRFVTNVCRVAGHAGGPAFRAMRGVTLIELLVVLVLIGAVLMVTMPVFSKGAQSLEARSAARQVYGVLRVARSNAIAQAERAVVLIDGGNGQISLLNSPVGYVLPRGVQFDLTDQGRGSERVVFYPDGSSSGARVALSNSHKRYRIDVESLTGQVSVDVDKSVIAQRL